MAMLATGFIELLHSTTDVTTTGPHQLLFCDVSHVADSVTVPATPFNGRPRLSHRAMMRGLHEHTSGDDGIAPTNSALQAIIQEMHT